MLGGSTALQQSVGSCLPRWLRVAQAPNPLRLTAVHRDSDSGQKHMLAVPASEVDGTRLFSPNEALAPPFFDYSIPFHRLYPCCPASLLRTRTYHPPILTPDGPDHSRNPPSKFPVRANHITEPG